MFLNKFLICWVHTEVNKTVLCFLLVFVISFFLLGFILLAINQTFLGNLVASCLAIPDFYCVR